MKKVLIKWEDTAATVGWYSREAVISRKCVFCESVGYLVHKDRDKVILSGMMADGEFNSLQYIPRGCIKEIKDID